MSINLEWMIAKKYIRYHQVTSLISYLSTVGIALGVMTLIIVMSVMNGYEVELMKKILGLNGHISISNHHQRILNYNHLIKKIKCIKNIEYVAPLVIGQALAEGNNSSNGVMVRGMDIQSLNNKPILNSAFIIKNDNSNFRKNEIYIGKVLAKNLNLSIGNKLRLIIPKLNTTILGTIPKIKTFYVAGIFDIGMYEYNSSMVFIPIQAAQLLFDTHKGISEIEVTLSDTKHLQTVKNTISKHIKDHSILITDWGVANESLTNALKIEKNTMFLILILIIIIATFNIISGLTMLVKEKYKSIAILRAIGVSRISIIKIFILVGVTLAFIGVLFGLILGILFLTNIKYVQYMLESATGWKVFDPMIYFLTSLPSQPSVKEIIIIVTISMIISLFATIYPAWKAANMLPAEALRYE